MARARLPIVPHLSPDEIARRYRACRSGVEKTHWQVLWLLTRSEAPPTPAEVAATRLAAAVISDRGCEATSLIHEDARRLVHRLKGEGRHGLCIISDEAASRLTPDNNAKAKSPRDSPTVAG